MKDANRTKSNKKGKGKKNMNTKKQSTRKRFWKYQEYYFLLLPALIYVLIFNYGPLYGVQIAFKNFYGSKGMRGNSLSL